MYKIICGDALEKLRSLPNESVYCCVTSPPYFGLRDYEVAGQLGNEETPSQYVMNIVAVFREVQRVLKNDGTLWLNLGDTYTQSGKGYDYDPKRTPKMRPTRVNSGKHWGYGPKQLLGIPWRVALCLQESGWILRQEIIWHKPNPMPESVKDRCTRAHESVFLLAKQPNYYYDFSAMQEPAVCAGQSRGGSKNRYNENKGLFPKVYNTRNMRSVWSIKPDVCRDKKHFATFPEELARRCILAGCPENETVLDPFLGSGTTAVVAIKNKRKCIGIELNPDYCQMAQKLVNKTKAENK